MSRFNNKCYKSDGMPKKLVVFIHGYNGTPEAIDYAVQSLVGYLKDAVVVVPEAPEVCEKNSDNKQWLSFYKVDPESRFRNVETTTSDIFEIFNKLSNDFSRVSKEINLFVNDLQEQFDIVDENVFLVGFSQGAMLSLYASLTRKEKIGGCVMNAGIVAGKDLLIKEMCSCPDILLLHGEADETVQYKTLPTSINWMLAQGLNLRCFTYPKLAHRMNDEEMQKAADFINSGILPKF